MAVDRSPASEQLWREFLAMVDGPGNAFDDDRALALLAVLNERAEPELVEWALPLLSSPEADRRWAAAWALQDHGTVVGRRYTAQIVPALEAAAALEQDDEVRAGMVHAIGRADPRGSCRSAHRAEPGPGPTCA